MEGRAIARAVFGTISFKDAQVDVIQEMVDMDFADYTEKNLQRFEAALAAYRSAYG